MYKQILISSLRLPVLMARSSPFLCALGDLGEAQGGLLERRRLSSAGGKRTGRGRGRSARPSRGFPADFAPSGPESLRG